jgi:hypothetical protein
MPASGVPASIPMPASGAPVLLLPGTLLLLPGKDAEEPVPMLLPTPLDGGLDVTVPPLLLLAPPELPIRALDAIPPEDVAANDDPGVPLEPAITDEAPPLDAAPEDVPALPPDEEPEAPPSVPTMPPPSGSNVMFPPLEDASPGSATLFSGQPSNSRPPATIRPSRLMRMWDSIPLSNLCPDGCFRGLR